jgi:hypothetical protein
MSLKTYKQLMKTITTENTESTEKKLTTDYV